MHKCWCKHLVQRSNFKGYEWIHLHHVFLCCCSSCSSPFILYFSQVISEYTIHFSFHTVYDLSQRTNEKSCLFAEDQWFPHWNISTLALDCSFLGLLGMFSYIFFCQFEDGNVKIQIFLGQGFGSNMCIQRYSLYVPNSSFCNEQSGTSFYLHTCCAFQVSSSFF